MELLGIFTHGISIIEQTSLLTLSSFARIQFKFYYIVYSLINQSLFIVTCAQQRSVLLCNPTIDNDKAQRSVLDIFYFWGPSSVQLNEQTVFLRLLKRKIGGWPTRGANVRTRSELRVSCADQGRDLW